ncbi:MAG: hypothetical protein Q9163_002610 [Psora crenata]
MGSASSKAAKAAATAGSRRQYPQRIPPNPSATGSTDPSAAKTSTPGPTADIPPQASDRKDETGSLDARDPEYSASLRSLGAVQPNPMLSNTSTFRPEPTPGSAYSFSPDKSSSDPSAPSGPNIFPNPARNPALVILESRNRLAAEAEKEFTRARTGGVGRRFLDIGIIRQILTMRDEKGMNAEEIERRMGLGKGVVGMLVAVGEGRMGKRDKDDSGIYD